MIDKTAPAPTSELPQDANANFWAAFLTQEKAYNDRIEKLRQGSKEDHVNALVLQGNKGKIVALLSAYTEDLIHGIGARSMWKLIDGLMIAVADKGYVGAESIAIIEAGVAKEAPGVSMADFAKDFLPQSHALREAFELTSTVQRAQNGTAPTIHKKPKSL